MGFHPLFFPLDFLLGNSLRTESEADAIYSHGMTFLRTHRVLTALSQRPEYIAASC